MNPDFPSAACRHLRDAKTLLPTSPESALYLAGYVAECSLKAVIERSGVHAPAFGHQLAKLEGDGFDLAVALAPRSARYRASTDSVTKLRSGWSEIKRYESTGDTTPEQAEEMVNLAGEIFRDCVIAMVLDGVLLELPT
jgi:HEPN domain-containing protein